jgi:CBS domain-containing protein
MMATYRVHAILVIAHGEKQLPSGRVWGIVSDTDLLRAAQTGNIDEQPARTVAGRPAFTVTSDDDLGPAAQLMVEQEVSHLIVVEPRGLVPIGVLSTLDVARALARFPERHRASR